MQSYVKTLLLTYEIFIGCFFHYQNLPLASDTNILITNSQTHVIFTKPLHSIKAGDICPFLGMRLAVR
jgi:hypothetical protein